MSRSRNFLTQHFPSPGPRSRDNTFRAFALALLFGCFAWPAYAVEVTKSPNDDRQYRYLQLPNQLQVLLISDPGTEKAAAALDVFVGSASDPADRQGLAHFLEHMLFLGTKKYPQPDEYQAYVNEHGGSHNAYTSFEHTNYFFDIDSEYLEPGLDRFAQFFIAPLFRAEYIDRERNAVHSEYQSLLNDEYRRTLDVYRQLMNPEHPLTKFSVGNLTTLSTNEDSDSESNLRQDLLNFYRQHYNARAMSLVVLGRENLDQLEQLLESRFAKIPNRETASEAQAATLGSVAEGDDNGGAQATTDGESLASPTTGGKDDLSDFLQPFFMPDDLPMQVFIEPKKEIRELSLVFPIPPVDPLYRRKPDRYLANLLGHEGEGSLLSVLKERGWAEELSAGVFLSTQYDALFQINITLTETGLSQEDSITGLVFAAIERVARNGIEEWRFAELQRLGEIAFRFQEKAPPLETVRNLAPNLHYYEPADVIAGDYLLQEYDPGLIKHFAASLNPNNALIGLTEPRVKTEEAAPYFFTPYRVDSSPLKLAELPADMARELELPDPNPFIPQDLALKPRPVSPASLARLIEDDPRLIKNAARIRVWFKQEGKFSVPRASTFMRIKSPEAAASLKGATLMRLYVEMVRDALNEYAYPASLAGLNFSLEANSRGLDVMVSGYSDGQDDLFRRIVEQMHMPRFSKQRFNTIKRKLLRQWQNMNLESPYNQITAAMPAIIFRPWWSNEDHTHTLVELGYDDLNQFAKRAFVDSRAELLLYGNMTRSEAAKLAGVVEVELLNTMADKTLPAAKVAKLPPATLRGEAPVFAKSINHGDKAVALYLQGNNDSLSENAYTSLLQQIIRSPFFHQLRTEQQLGYVVFAAAMPFKDVPGTILLVQSPTASLDTLMNAIEAFVRQALDVVPSDLAQHKSALINQLLEAPKNLQEQGTRYWESIIGNDDAFDRRERLAEAVSAIGVEELSAYVHGTLVQQPRALWVLAAANPLNETAEQGDEQSGWMSIDQSPSFKATREAYVYP